VTFRWLAALFTLFILVLVAWAAWEARGWPLQARLMPWMIGIPTTLLVAAQLIRDLRREPSGAAERQESGSSGQPEGQSLGQAPLVEEAGPALEPAEERRRTANAVGWIVGFALAIWLLGFHIGVPLATLLYLRLAGREGWPITLILSAGAWASIALFFDCTMHILFSPGELFVWLGLEPGPFYAQVCLTFRAMLPR
jgi:hypothetical protein